MNDLPDDSDKMRTVIHIGRHKCASTSLQKFFFPQLTKFFFNNKAILRFLQDEGNDGNAVRKYINRNFTNPKHTDCLNPAQESLRIISREGLSKKHIDIYASKLKDAYPDAKIICIIREQFDMLLTLYVWLTGKRFLVGGLNRSISNIMTSSDRDFLYHNKAIKKYIAFFGKENVLVIPYELLKKDTVTFYRTIINFIQPALIFRIPEQKKNISYKKKAVDNGIVFFNVFITLLVKLPFQFLHKAGLDPGRKKYRRV
jgi:hypothetical protein